MKNLMCGKMAESNWLRWRSTVQLPICEKHFPLLTLRNLTDSKNLRNETFNSYSKKDSQCS